ncbi:MAG: hypothetical protein HY902_03525 [Deltaproteobacteria bacterium]|nr:hypothetical protein [Deltaproteobacteria bacterium]
MTLRWKTALATLALTALPAVAFAETDATSTPDDATAVAGDATVTTDTGTTTDTTTTDTTTTDTSGGFNENPCWDQKCAKETDACKADKDCVAAHNCGSDQTCLSGLKFDDATIKKVQGLLNAIANCGYKSCNDPTKGTCKDKCGKFLGDTAPCNCDEACKDFGDCCQDYDALCGGSTGAVGSCEGKCGKYIEADKCHCDELCGDPQYNDCCDDYAKLCGGSTGGDTGTQADVSSCTAKCAGKKCGDGDGCGGKCSGTCDNGGICSAAKTCTGGSTSDVTSGKDSGSLDATGTGTGTGTGNTNTGGNNTSNASSCNASGTSNGSWGLVLVLFGLIGAVVLRRRAV